jgi:hypothetical protein
MNAVNVRGNWYLTFLSLPAPLKKNEPSPMTSCGRTAQDEIRALLNRRPADFD